MGSFAASDQQHCRRKVKGGLTTAMIVLIVLVMGQLASAQMCGPTQLTDTRGSFGTTYARSSQPNCSWTITADDDSVILLAINQELNWWNYNCNNTVKIFEGSEADDQHLIRDICVYEKKTGLVFSQTSNLLVVLTRPSCDRSVSMSATYTTVKAATVNRSCGGSLTGTEGTITSPNYPNHYDNLMECTWTITVDPAFSINFDVNYSLPRSDNCSSDSMMIWPGNDTTGVVQRSVCGGKGRLQHQSNTHRVVLKFVSDQHTTDTGFSVHWYTECGKPILCGHSGTLQSPNYPHHYPGGLSCSNVFPVIHVRWYGYSDAQELCGSCNISELEPGHSILLNFSSFQLEGPSTNGSCSNDYLEIAYTRTRGLVPERQEIRRYCGDVIPTTLTLYPPVEVHFVSDQVNSRPGFQATYTFVKAGCGETVFTGPKGTITSPNYPGSFPDDIDCTYIIRVDQGQIIHLVSHDFDMDWACVSIYEGNVSHTSICNDRPMPTPIFSAGNTLTLEFHSSLNYLFRSGFSLNYFAISASAIFDACGGELSGHSGQIVSPGFPHHYPNGTVCVWAITGEARNKIRIEFSRLDLQEATHCHLDSLEFRNGLTGKGSLLERVCGDTLPSDVISADNEMHIRFVTDLHNSRTGFNLTWTSACIENYRGSSGTIDSSDFEVGRECVFIIEQNPGYFIQLEFEAFNLGGDGGDCKNTFLEVRDGGFGGSPLLGQRYCGNTPPPPLPSSQNMMWIRYVTDGSDAKAGFRANYTRKKISCDRVVLRADRGTFTSPGFPADYPHNMNCSWVIEGGPNDVIQLTFDTFMLEGPSSCPYDWVDIHDGTTLIDRFCGSTGPHVVTSSSNKVTVTFRSDFSQTFEGFSVSYTAHDPFSDGATMQHELYPYGRSNGDKRTKRKKPKRIRLRTGFPAGSKLHEKLFISTNGLVSFGKRERGKHFKLKKDIAMLCPYNADIQLPNKTGGVYYHLYQDGDILSKASSQIRDFTEHKEYTARLVLVITWDHVTHQSSKNPVSHQATVQLALMSDGQRSYGVVYYKRGEMNWAALDNQPLIIGFSDGEKDLRYSDYCNTTEAFTQMDKIRGNTGRYGMWLYSIGDSYNREQICLGWYKRNARNTDLRQALKRLPDCPCNTRFLWGGWRFSHWRDGHHVRCFRMTVSRSRQFAPHGKECCYTWDSRWWSSSGQYISDPPHAGSATAFNPALWSLRGHYRQEDQLPHDACCYNNSKAESCISFYTMRPPGSCSTKIPFSFSWTWGDPHIKTLDGGEYTFNGWGEYTMVTLTSGDLTFTLQGRTGLAETESGSVTNATVFTALGAEENGVRVFVGLEPNTNDSLIIYGNNSDYSTAFIDAADETILVDSENFMLQRVNESCVVTFATDIQLTVSIGFKALDISVAMPLKYRNLTRGLMGNFNGVKDDDFILPDGTVLKSNLTDRQIYEEFGPQWAVTESDSVMRYGPREGTADFAHPEFTPIFLDEISPATRQAAEALCGRTNVACVYDYVATGSAAIANASRDTANRAEETERIAKNTIPILKFNATVLGTSGKSLNFNLQGYDPDTNDVLTYYVVDSGNGTADVSSHSGNVTLNVDISKPVSLRFYAVDSQRVQSPVRDVTLITCSGCTNHGTCDYSQTTSSGVTGFLIAECDCHDGWAGEQCEEDYDACQEGPCDVHQTCTDLSPDQQGGSDVGFTCSGCSDGFRTDAEDATRCIDIDECSQQQNCSHNCINTPGSYTCACRDGYRLSSDDVSCDDVNECVERSHGCQQECVNTEGSFHCQCYHGYTLSDKGICEADPTLRQLCNEAGCDHGCTTNTTTDSNNDTVAQCFCNSGYSLDPANNRSCEDRDECSEGVCSHNCTNTPGSFICTCNPGYVMSSDQRTCHLCEKLRYGPQCRLTCQCSGRGLDCHPVTGCVCQAGWTGSQCQDDVNECLEDPDVCGEEEGKRCVNNNGSYTCVCPDGYTDNGKGVCADVDECSEMTNCTDLEQCHNTPGSYFCTCIEGYTSVDGQCIDIDECVASSQNQCQQLCNNLPGSYNCDCRYGYRLNQDRTSCSQVKDVCAEVKGLHCDHGCSLSDDDDTAFCFCETGFVLAEDQRSCVDENECALNTSSCSTDSVCVNTEGGYTCRCPLGSHLDSDGLTCKPCPDGTYGENCSKSCACGLGSSHCDVTTGCVCKSGWKGERCDEDVNECETVQPQEECLAQNASCMNIPGGYQCRCAPGYEKVDRFCQDVNECAETVANDCEQLCINTAGSFVCGCLPGFAGSDNDCRALARLAVTVTSEIAAPPELTDTNSTTYVTWTQLAGEALFKKLKPEVPGLEAVIIQSLRLGSLIIDADVVVNNETHPEASSSLTLALLNLGQGRLAIGNQTGNISVAVNGLTVNSSSDACEVYEMITVCQLHQLCHVTDGLPACRNIVMEIAYEDGDSVVFVALGTSVAFVLAAVLITIIVWVKLKPSQDTGPAKGVDSIQQEHDETTIVKNGAYMEEALSVEDVSVSASKDLVIDNSQSSSI